MDDYDWGFGDVGYFNDLSVEENNELAKGRNTATASGNDKLKGVFDFIFNYGSKALVLLSTAGVIGKNRGAAQLSSGAYSEARLQQLLDANGGTLSNPDFVTMPNTTTQASFLGIPTNTLLTVAAIGAGAYFITNSGKKRKSK